MLPEPARSGDAVAVSDPLEAAQEVKQTAIVLREARSLLRRADKLQAAVVGLEDASSTRLVAELCRAAKALADAVARLEVAKQRRAKSVLRGRRGEVVRGSGER
jgi:hypothetical protein